MRPELFIIELAAQIYSVSVPLYPGWASFFISTMASLCMLGPLFLLVLITELIYMVMLIRAGFIAGSVDGRVALKHVGQSKTDEGSV